MKIQDAAKILNVSGHVTSIRAKYGSQQPAKQRRKMVES